MRVAVAVTVWSVVWVTSDARLPMAELTTLVRIGAFDRAKTFSLTRRHQLATYRRATVKTSMVRLAVGAVVVLRVPFAIAVAVVVMAVTVPSSRCVIAF